MEGATNSKSVGHFLLTPRAESFMRRMVRLSGRGASAGFHLSVSPGGCSGMSATFDVESAPREGEHALEREGLRVFVPEPSYRMLEGVTIDFTETSTESGFSFHDPKAGSCGCASGTEVRVPLTRG